MQLFECTLSNIQQIDNLKFKIDLSKNKLLCITGKNSCGKTTLIRAIKTIQSADIFNSTASPHTLNNNSQINFNIDRKSYNYQYNEKIKTIDSRKIVEPEIQDNIYVELPIPHGERFNHFQKLGNIDEDLRKNISLKNHKKATGLIKFFHQIYKTDKFKDLQEVTIKKQQYYFILKANDFYIREDYFSSGEYFLTSLYKIIQRKRKLIVIDEIDISLDTSAQVNLIETLRDFCNENKVNIVFTTHSMAMMRKLKDDELYYMDKLEDTSKTTIQKQSYAWIQSVLFKFKGWDKYILTEDEMLKNYLEYLIRDEKSKLCEYKIIYIAGHSNTVDLMKRNANEEFFSTKENVRTVLDGDAKNEYLDNREVLTIPFASIEKYLFQLHKNNDLPENIQLNANNPKDLFNKLKEKGISNEQIFDFIGNKKSVETNKFKQQIIYFLSYEVHKK